MLVSTEEHQPINKYCFSLRTLSTGHVGPITTWELSTLSMTTSTPGHVCPPATARPQGRMWMSRFWAAFWVKHQRFQVPRIQVLTYVSTIEYGCCEGKPTIMLQPRHFAYMDFTAPETVGESTGV